MTSMARIASHITQLHDSQLTDIKPETFSDDSDFEMLVTMNRPAQIGSGVVDFWTKLMRDGERILWQGGPDSPYRVDIGSIVNFGFGILLLIGSIRSTLDGSGSAFEAFGSIAIFVFGCAFLGTAVFYSAIDLRKHRCLFTNGRAVIATGFPDSDKTESYPIDTHTLLIFKHRRWSNIYFQEQKIDHCDGTSYRKIGSANISDGKAVYNLMRQVQRGQSPQ